MCGIIAAWNYKDNKETVNRKVAEQLEDQIHRGEKGFGIAFFDKDNKVEVKRSCGLTLTHIDLATHPGARGIMLHHRFPTSSDNKISQTHPIEVDDKSFKHKYLVVHNGVISNAKELHDMHVKKLELKYTTEYTIEYSSYDLEKFNDSESLAIELARYIENKTSKVGTEGSAAFIALQIDKKTEKVTKIFFGRNSNPLKIHKTGNSMMLSSEGPGGNIKENKLYSCDPITFEISKKKCVFEPAPAANISTRSKPSTTYKETESGVSKQLGFNTENSSGYLEGFKKDADGVYRPIKDKFDSLAVQDDQYDEEREPTGLEVRFEELEDRLIQIQEELISDLKTQVYAGDFLDELEVKGITEIYAKELVRAVNGKVEDINDYLTKETLKKDYQGAYGPSDEDDIPNKAAGHAAAAKP